MFLLRNRARGQIECVDDRFEPRISRNVRAVDLDLGICGQRMPHVHGAAPDVETDRADDCLARLPEGFGRAADQVEIGS